MRKPAVERSKDRVLSRDETQTLWAALDGPHFSTRTAAALRLMRGEVVARPVMVSWQAVMDYCRATMGFEMR